MEPALTDMIDLLGAVAADLQDVACRLEHTPAGLNPSDVLWLELSTITVEGDAFSRRIAAVHEAIASAIALASRA